MKIEFKAFIKKTEPINVLALIDDKVLQYLLDGYSAALSSGLCIYFNTGAEEVSLDTLDYISAFGEKVDEFFYPLCAYYRHVYKCDEFCQGFDRQIALKYYRGDWKGPKLHRCLLNLWDMKYPLYIGNNLVGILYAGQAVVKDEKVSWRKELMDIEDQVVWGNFPETGSQLDDICSAIDVQEGLNPSQKSKAKRILRKESYKRGKNITVQGLIDRYQGFLEFGKMMQRLLKDLYEAKKDLAIRELMQEIAGYLAKADISTQEDWAKYCDVLFSDFSRELDIGRVHIYTRSGANFTKQIPYSEDEKSRIRAKYVISAVELGRLISLDKDNYEEKELLEKLELGMKDIHVFRDEYRAESGMLASLTVVCGNIRSEDYELVGSFCKVTGMHSNIMSLVFQLRDAQDKFKLRVGEVAHAFRTPLQILLMDISEISRKIKDDDELSKLLNESKIRLIGAKEDLLALLEDVKEERVDCDIVSLVEEIVNELTPTANAHPCSLIKAGSWPAKAMIHANKIHMRHALLNLVENAIKYSWKGKIVEGRKVLYKVIIKINLTNYEMVEILIRNYGIGIPPEFLKEIRKLGTRAEVPDWGQERQGTGLGVAFANNIIEEYGGWLEINSERADDNSRGLEELYHRYITEVKVYLPITHVKGD